MANTISLSQILQSRPAVCPTIYGYILPGVPDHNGYIKVGYTDKDDVEVVVKPKNLPKKILLSLLTTVIVGAGAYYMMIPALNFKSTDFYTFIFLLIAVFVGSFFLFIGGN